jgi:hypothetical protein
MALLIYQIDVRRNIGPLVAVVDSSGKVETWSETAIVGHQGTGNPNGREDRICVPLLMTGPIWEQRDKASTASTSTNVERWREINGHNASIDK